MSTVRTARISFVAAATLCTSFSPAQASSLRVSPILIDGGSNANTSITLHNGAAQPLNAQVRVFRWSQKDGDEELVPTDDVVASPPIVAVGAGEDYVVRLQRTTGQEPVNEEAYRVVVDELPNPDRQRNGTVAVVLRYIVPAFFFPPDATQARIKWSIATRDGHPVIVAENSGDKRLQLTNLAIKSGGRTALIEKGLAGYVLGHSTKEWPLNARFSGLRKGTIVAMSDSGAVHASLAP